MAIGKVVTLDSKLAEISSAQIEADAGLPFALLHADQDVTLILYAPGETDAQSPHDRDEYYFVASGAGAIEIEQQRTAVNVGDAIFVPAHAEHRFVDTSADFACWALFYGSVKSSAKN